MTLDLIPRSFWNVSSRLPSLFEEDDWQSFLPSSGLSVSENSTHVFVEAQMPGLDPENIEVTFDKGVLWIRGGKAETEEDKDKKYYRKASSSFSYHVNVPGLIDTHKEPDVTYKHGVLRASFEKMPEEKPKKIAVKTE